ncbi:MULTISPECIES: sporulation integral membrane protein YtvI [Brevibacillus]|uniref:sporulation integral membrane protein YtvI n=1 Tax=Brevibacillus TaxID=55080 RepID=UPI000EE7D587|nr:MULTISPECIES: sporulation integral membrane protein YtvI [Brevibacillus]MDR5000397.1 sporulation integral membrane protein YtvI [Brevibacillus parabrevis]MED2256617.1 sporulation integral membrane protein YtvI [Brevibacillus parabrevis]NRQ52798.1 sporulation integral membrane protein YtvI [Brevibacillus sp. HD1.4A]WDV96652.1 sporulation integral membrane protein YtvI [Brevibacillus parabrevis]HBZ81029.1 sporulation integral membrane protein YtvI [Brevibacillus sp.]
MNQENWVERVFQIIRFFWVCLLVYVGIWLFQFATPLLYPFIIALVIALMIHRPVTFITKKFKIPRWLSVTIALLVLMLLAIGLATLVVTETVVEIGELAKRLPVFAQELSEYLQRTISQDFLLGIYNQVQWIYDQLDPNYKDKISNTVGSGITSITHAGQNLIVSFLDGLKNLLVSLPNMATVSVISIMGAFFISKDFFLWESRFRRLLPSGVNNRLDQIFRDLRAALFGFIKAQVTLISLTAAIVIIGLLIMRVEYAITIGLITGLVDLLPYLGTGTVFVPWIIYMFFKGNYTMVIGLSILYAVVLIFRQIIEPKVVAESVGLDPLLTLVALFVGLQLFGFLGLIIGPVSLVLINALVKANVFVDIWMYIKGKRT